MGSIPRHFVLTPDIDGQESEIHEPSGRRAAFADFEGNWADAFDVLFGCDGVDNFQGGEYWNGLGICLRSV